MKLINTAHVMLWGTRIGVVNWDEERAIGRFEYDPDFLEAHGIEVAPFMMVKRKGVFSFPQISRDTFKGLPGFLADSLPDKFGNVIIRSWLARQGILPSEFSPVANLCQVGTRGMGALEFFPQADQDLSSDDQPIEVQQMVELASSILAQRGSAHEKLVADHDKENQRALSRLIQIGTSAGGARAKILLAINEETGEVRSGQLDWGSKFKHYLMKLDGVSENGDRDLVDPGGFGKIEYAYYQMATDCKIEMSKCRLFKENGRHHFLTERFDRRKGQKIHMQSLCALRHFDFNIPGAHGYEQLMETIRMIVKHRQNQTLEQMYRRAVFNVVARNQDDHTKNFAFLMDRKGQWSLSPAFDVTYSYRKDSPWVSRHQMTVNGKRDDFSLEDFIALGMHANLTEGRAISILKEIVSVVENVRSYLENNDVKPEFVDEIENNVRLDFQWSNYAG